MREGIDARAPFCDYRIIELLYILPLNYKYRLKTEKKILRDCFKKEVIKDVITRKKSPYPKSRTKEYEEKVKIELLNVLSKESILNELFNKEKLIDFINDDKEMEEPWYGQLMRKTSFLAYLYQIDYWYKKYNIRIDIVGK
jgi:asparagine synthase (glutamine-hydrolysing)